MALFFQFEICAANGQRAGAARDQRPVLARRDRRARHTSCRSAKDNARVDGLACKGSHALPRASLNSRTTFRSAVRARCNRCRCAAVIAHFPHAARPRQRTPTFALAFARLVAAPTLDGHRNGNRKSKTENGKVWNCRQNGFETGFAVKRQNVTHRFLPKRKTASKQDAKQNVGKTAFRKR